MDAVFRHTNAMTIMPCFMTSWELFFYGPGVCIYGRKPDQQQEFGVRYSLQGHGEQHTETKQ